MTDTIRSLTVKGKEDGLDALAASLRAVMAAQQGLIQSGAALEQASDKVARKTTDQQASFTRLVAQLDPVAAAAGKLERQMNVLFRAFDMGAATLPQLNSQLALATAAFEKVAAANSKMDHSGLNELLGVQTQVTKGAKESASAFEVARIELNKLADAERYYAQQAAQRAASGPNSSAAINARMGIGQSNALPSSVFEENAQHAREAQEYYAAQRASAAAVGPNSAGAINERLGIGADPSVNSAQTERAFTEAFAQEEAMLNRAMKAQQALNASRDEKHSSWLDARDIAQMREFNAEQEQMGREANALKAALQPAAHALDVYNQSLARAGELLREGKISEELHAAAVVEAQRVYDHVQRTYGGDKGANASKLAATQFTNLGYQVNDIISGLAMGQSPMTIVTQQGGQVYQALASARGGIVGGFQAVTASVGGFLAGISPVIGVLGGVATGALAAAIAYNRFASSQREVALALSGAGRASGTSVGQINAIANGNAAAGGISTAAATSIAAQAAQTGKIGPDIYAGLIKSAKDYALVTGTDVPEAGKKLIAALVDPAKGADALNESLGGLDATTRHTIITLAESGDRAGAQRMIMETFAGTIKSAGENVTTLNKILSESGRYWSEFWTNVGKGVEVLTKGGVNPEEQLAAMAAQLDRLKAANSSGVASFLPDWMKTDALAQAQAAYDKLAASIRRQKGESDAAAKAQRSLEVQTIVQGQNPQTKALEEMENKAKNIAAYLKDGGVDADGRSRRAMDGLITQAKQLKEDMAAGGAAYADAIKAAGFAQRTVNFSPGALTVAQINENASNKATAATREAGTNTNSSEFFARLQSIEVERVTQIATAAATAATGAANQGGAFSRMSPEVQQRILAGQATLAPSLTIDQIAAVFEKESSGRLNMGLHGPTSTAYGIGGMTVGAERDVRNSGIIPGFDRTNPNTSIEGSMAYLQMRINRAGGDVNAGLNGYGTGPGYAADVNRKAGTGGAQSTLAVSQQFDENARAVKEQNAVVDINTRLLGVNGEKLDAATRARQLLADAEAKGIPLTDQYRQMLEQTATGLANAAQRMKMVSFTNDINFERDQLGRNTSEQAQYARVRSQFGDTTSDAARTALEMARANDNLKITKDMATGMFQGIGQDLMNGVKAADAFHNAFTRMASKLLDMSIDNVVSKLFGAAMGASNGGGGGGGLFSSLFSGFGNGASGGTAPAVTASANGNIMTSSGPLPLNMYANGGIANKAQVSIFGEGRQPEAYVPLPDGRSIPVSMRMSGGANDTGGARPQMQAQTVVHNYGDQQVSTKTTQTPKGPRTDIVIGKHVEQYLLSPEATPVLRKLGLNRAANGR